MLKEVVLAFREAGFFVWLALRSLCFWRKLPPVTTTEELRKFIETRAKSVTQITLFGYLKTRAGTRYTSLFEDDVFANSISIAIMEIYLISLSDLTVFAVARVGRDAGAGADETRSLALRLHNHTLDVEEIPEYRPQGYDAARDAFAARVADVAWPEMAEGGAAFVASQAALVEWAPVAPELKSRDTEIVETSMWFKWKAVREQFGGLLDADAVIAAWRAEQPQTAPEAITAAPEAVTPRVIDG